MRYPWADTYAALMALRENGECDPYDGIMIMLASPVDGGPTLPTIAWQAQLLPKNKKPCRIATTAQPSTSLSKAKAP